MNSSTLRPCSAQPRSPASPPARIYIATSGQDLIEVGLTLDWITDAVLHHCRETGEDIALWMAQGDNSPWIIAAVRRSPDGSPFVCWL